MHLLDPQMPMRRDPKENICRILVLVLCAFGFFLLLNRQPWSASRIERYNQVQDYREETWVLRDEDQILDPALTLPHFMHLETGKRYSISTRLTYDGSKAQSPACFFFVDHMFCEAYLDGELMFRYTEQEAKKPDASRSPGNVYASFYLPQDCMGKELTIVFIPALSSSVEYQLPNPSCGDYLSQSVQTLRHEMSDNIVAVLFAFIGVVAILFSSLVLPRQKYKEGLFIGIFSFLVSCYNLTESDFAFYMISNPYYTYVLDYVTFTLIPIFLLAFLRERLDPEQKPLALVLILLDAAMFLTEMVLHFLGLVDMREFLPILHVVYLADFGIFFIMLLRMKNHRWKKQLILQMIPILLGLILDAAVYYLHWQLGTSDSGFTSMGVFLFLIVEFYHVWHYSIDVYTLSTQSQEYMQMAYIDALTGIGNRRAFEREKDVIASGKREFNSILIASADLNNLKPTNDTYGHAAGDFLIRSAAQVLTDLSHERCHCFRMGGDEFLVLIYDMEAREFEQCLEGMRQRIEKINENSEVKLSIALGYEVIHHKNVDFAVETADQKMYLEKARCKKKDSV